MNIARLINSCRYTRVGQAKVAHRLDRSRSKEVERGKRCYVTPHPRRAEIDKLNTIGPSCQGS